MPTCSPGRPAPTTTWRRRWGSSSWEIRGRSQSAAVVEPVGPGRGGPGIPSKEVGDAYFHEMGRGPARRGRLRGNRPAGGARRARGDGGQAAPAAAEVGPEGVGSRRRRGQEGHGLHRGTVRGGP